MNDLCVRLLPSSALDPERTQCLTSFLVDDHIAVDAGALGLWTDPATLRGVDHVFLTHSHADHVATLPVFLEFRDSGSDPGFSLHAHADTLRALETDVFNDRIWPSLERFAWNENRRWHTLEAGVPVGIGPYRVTPVPMDHPVPTFGFLIERGGRGVIIAGDTGPTEALWALARRTPDLAAIFVETSFPDSMRELAEVSGHLTPSLLALELDKMPGDVPVFVVHIKPRFREQVAAELGALRRDRLEIGIPGRDYRFP